jgi:UDP-GlcNAc:undecaprenyl-phosphate GlcNAc-1-phosphate transferase
VDELLEFFNLNLMIFLRYFLLLTVSALSALFLLPYLKELLIDSNLIKPNYRGEMIPAAAGLLFIMILPFTVGAGFLLEIKSFDSRHAVLFLVVVLGMGFAGLVDDCLGNHQVKGFKGHLRAFFKERKLTTGAFKALFGGIIALVFSMANARLNGCGRYPWMFLVDFLLVALAANIINLFDLRPGRAGKVFLFIFTIILLLSQNFINFIGLFFPVLIILLLYLPRDLKAQMMLGDVGSNFLGATLGIMMVWMLSDFGKIVALVFFLVLQLIAEKFSFSKIIEKYRPLRYLDQIGRE